MCRGTCPSRLTSSQMRHPSRSSSGTSSLSSSAPKRFVSSGHLPVGTCGTRGPGAAGTSLAAAILASVGGGRACLWVRKCQSDKAAKSGYRRPLPRTLLHVAVRWQRKYATRDRLCVRRRTRSVDRCRKVQDLWVPNAPPLFGRQHRELVLDELPEILLVRVHLGLRGGQQLPQPMRRLLVELDQLPEI